MTQPITLNQRTATTVAQLVDRMQQAQETLRTYIEAVGAALDVPPGWRFDVQTMAFMPPQEPPEILGLSQEFTAAHEAVFCNTEPAEQAANEEDMP